MVLLPQLRRAASSLSPYLRMQHELRFRMLRPLVLELPSTLFHVFLTSRLNELDAA